MKKLKYLAIPALSFILILILTLITACSGAGDTNSTPGGDSIDTSKKYTVTIINDGVVRDTLEVQGGDKISRPDTPKKNGHTFGGWYDGDVKWNFASDKVTKDVTLEALWIADELSVVFDYGDGHREEQTVKYGETVTFPDEPTKKDYKFDGWYNGLKLWTADTPVKTNMTLTASWKLSSLTVKFDTLGGSVIDDVHVEYGEVVARPLDPTKTDHTFLGWYYNGKPWNFDTPITESITIAANWQSNFVTVTFNTDGGSSIDSQRIAYGTALAAPSEPTKANYSFAGWYLGGKAWDFDTPVTDSITLVARWEPVYVTVTFDCSGGSTILPMSVRSGSTIASPSNTSKTDYVLSGWLLGNEEFNFSTPITQDITLTANWRSVLEQQWLDYQKIMPADTYAALRKLYDFYSGDAIIDWMASLWDSDVGAFYYSNSARDSYGYLPDVESTHQILGWLTANGAFKNDTEMNKLFPNSIKLALVDFVRNMQSSSDGYFYHPQWPQGTANLQTDRYGRDLSWAQSMFTRFTVDTNGDGIEEKQYPNYCTPGGTKCKAHASGGSCSFATAATCFTISPVGAALTSPLSASGITSAVSRVTSSSVSAVASVSSQPDYSSSAAFTAWLEAYNSNIKVDSGRAHNINALQSEIIAKGYCDELLDYLDKIQKEVYSEQIKAGDIPTGLWQKPVNYRAVWGLLKYAPFYNNSTYGREIKYPKLIVATAIKVIESAPITDGTIFMNDLYNQWSSINSLLTNVKKYNPDMLEEIYEMMREKAPSLISNSLLKITPYKNENGAFGYTDKGKSLTHIYGVPISLGVVESDVNGTGLCCSMYRCIMTCLGYTAVPLCTSTDGLRFINTITNASGVKKYHTFTQGIESSVTFEDKTGGGSMTVVADPKDSTNSVLQFNSVKTSLSNSDRVRIKPVSGSGHAYVFDTDMYLKSTSDDGYLFQIKMGDLYMISLWKSGSTVYIKETCTTANSTSTDLAETKTNTWFNLRIEYYDATATGDIPKIKIFLNGDYVKTTSGYYGSTTGAAPGKNYDSVSFYSMRSCKTELLLDNGYFATEDKPYVD